MTAWRSARHRSATQPPRCSRFGPAKIDLDTAMIDQTLGAKGQIAGGVYQVSIARAETIKDGDMDVPVAMGSAEAINFQPTGDGKAAITGDLVLTAQEVNPGAARACANGIEVTALHNHMLDDQPRLFFMHFWAHDDAAEAGQRPEERSRQDQRRAELALRKTPAAKAALRLLMAALLVTLCASVRAEAPALQLERTIPLPEVTGRIDHMAIDLGRRRLFVAELGNNTVDVIDLASGKAAHRIERSQGAARHRLRTEGGCDRHCQCRRRIGSPVSRRGFCAARHRCPR